MQFKDAAFEILKSAGQPLHYRDITIRAKQANLLDTVGRTPEATMGALLYTDTLNVNSRFRRGEIKGTFSLKTDISGSIEQQINAIRYRFCTDLHAQLLSMSPQKFEELIRQLLEEMGFEETVTTPFVHDQGVDVRGVLRTNPLSVTKVAIQVKRWADKVGPDIVRRLRGSIRLQQNEQGLIITSSGFTVGAIEEANADGMFPIGLINGDQLVDLLIEYKVGIKEHQYTVPIFDSEYWSEIFGIEPPEPMQPRENVQEDQTVDPPTLFPLEILAVHQGQEYIAQLEDISGVVTFNGKEYQTPSGAARIIATNWTSVNGWDFWKYRELGNGNLMKIGNLRRNG